MASKGYAMEQCRNLQSYGRTCRRLCLLYFLTCGEQALTHTGAWLNEKAARLGRQAMATQVGLVIGSSLVLSNDGEHSLHMSEE